VFPVRYELNFYKLSGINLVFRENVKCLNLAVAKLTTVEVTKLPL
jgi:hypothetical protein